MMDQDIIKIDELPESLVADPYQTIITWSEKRFKKIGNPVFSYLALLPHSLFIPPIPYEDTFFQTGLSFLLLTPPSGAKCIKKGSLVLMESGELKRIEDIKVNERVMSLNKEEFNIEPKRVINAINNGFQDCVKIKTKSGREISATKVHPFLTIDGWKKIEEIKEGEFIAVPREYKISGNDVNNEKIILLAYLLADGHLGKAVSFTNSNQEILNEFRECIIKFDKNLRVRETNRKGVISLHLSNLKEIRNSKGWLSKNPLHQWIVDLGLDKTNSYSKFIPLQFINMNNHCISIFLNRLWACDGTISKSKQGNKDRYGIEYSSNSYKLCKGIQHLLLRLGIVSIIRKRDFLFGIKKLTNYKVLIRDVYSMKKFVEKVGLIKSKEERSKEILNLGEKKSTNIDIIPHNFWRYLIREKKELNLSWRDIHQRGDKINSEFKKKNIRRENLKMFNTPLSKKYSSSDIFWDKVKSIEKDGINEVIDIEIEDNHNFVAEDFFIHNTLIGRAVEKMVINPVPFEDISSAEIQSELRGKEDVTFITGDAGRVFKDPDLLKVLEGILSDSRVSKRNKREKLDFAIRGNCYMAGTPQDLSSYIYGGFLSRITPMVIMHKVEEQDEIGKEIVKSIGKPASDEDVKISDIAKYYQWLYQVQKGAIRDMRPIEGYYFDEKFKETILTMWKEYRKRLNPTPFENYYRELIAGFKYLCTSAFLNINNRKIANNLLVPTQHDLEIAISLMQNELRTKVHILKSEKVARRLADTSYLEIVAKQYKLSTVSKEMIRMIVEGRKQ